MVRGLNHSLCKTLWVSFLTLTLTLKTEVLLLKGSQDAETLLSLAKTTNVRLCFTIVSAPSLIFSSQRVPDVVKPTVSRAGAALAPKAFATTFVQSAKMTKTLTRTLAKIYLKYSLGLYRYGVPASIARRLIRTNIWWRKYPQIVTPSSVTDVDDSSVTFA